uniref:Uncharacterized protein n=1 Tax=Rhizophora mucronata TaxID=61149 RepID=A0A2P2PGQ8_RHIMU
MPPVLFSSGAGEVLPLFAAAADRSF